MTAPASDTSAAAIRAAISLVIAFDMPVATQSASGSVSLFSLLGADFGQLAGAAFVFQAVPGSLLPLRAG